MSFSISWAMLLLNLSLEAPLLSDLTGKVTRDWLCVPNIHKHQIKSFEAPGSHVFFSEAWEREHHEIFFV